RRGCGAWSSGGAARSRECPYASRALVPARSHCSRRTFSRLGAPDACRPARGSSIDDAAILRAAAQAIQEARATGTALVGDVTNTLATVSALADAGMPAHVFHELIGFGGVGVDEQAASAGRAIEAAADGAVADDAVAYDAVAYDAVAYDAIAEDQDIRLSL